MTQPQPSPSAVLGLDPIELLARGIANFQSDLAAADGPAYSPMAVDPRLAALTLRLVLRLAEASRTTEDYGTGYETTALDDFIEDIENASNAVLGDPRP
jgi:hypothetical protein